jgi:hypothetical protein
MEEIENGIKALAIVFLNSPLIILFILETIFGSRIILLTLCISSAKLLYLFIGPEKKFGKNNI